jgi:hypothetical protein
MTLQGLPVDLLNFQLAISPIIVGKISLARSLGFC